MDIGKYLSVSSRRLPPDSMLSSLTASKTCREQQYVVATTCEGRFAVLDIDQFQIVEAEVLQLTTDGIQSCRLAGCPAILNDEAYLYDLNSGTVVVVPLKATPELSEDNKLTLRVQRLSDRGIFEGFNSKLIQIGSLEGHYFEILKGPPTLIAATQTDELEIHSIAMGSMLRISHDVNSVAALDSLQLTDDSWCLASMATSGRTTLFKGREDRSKEALVVDKSVFDTGLGAWDADEPEEIGQRKMFEAMCVERSQRRVVIAARKVPC